MTTATFLLILAAAAFHAIWNLYVRKVAGNLFVLWLGLLFGCLALLPGVVLYFLLAGFPQGIITQYIFYIALTGFIHAIYFFVLGKAYQHGEISFVYPIARGSGVALTAISAWVLLSEGFTSQGSAGIILVCVGIISLSVIATNGVYNNRSLLLSILIGFSIAAYSIVDKIAVQFINPVIYIWSMFLVSSLFLAPYMLFNYKETVLGISKQYFWHAVIIGVGSIGTYLMILFAFTMGPVGYVVAIREFSVVIGSLLGIVLLKERISALKLTAISVIVIGVIFIKISQ